MNGTKTVWWVVTTDERVGRLFRLERTERGSPHLEVVDELEEVWDEKEHGRPSARAGRTGNSHASSSHEDDARRTRFAKEVAAWLQRHARQLDGARVTLFAPPRFLGALRGVWPGTLASTIDECHGDLAHLSAGDLARHRSITELLGNGRG